MLRFIAALMAVLVVLSTGACAEQAGPIRRVVVSTDGLNLNREADASIMLQRLAAATDRVCGGRPFTQNMHPAAAELVADYRRCRDQAMADAVAALRAPLLERLYALGGGRADCPFVER